MPSVGIFWVYKNEVIGHIEDHGTADVNETGMLDSDAQHITEWQQLLSASKYAKELSGKAYESVLRGRVLFDVRNQKHVLYTDLASVTASNKNRVLDFFELKDAPVRWCHDHHYSLEGTISDLFEDWGIND